jgi:hypothetical protein
MKVKEAAKWEEEGKTFIFNVISISEVWGHRVT